MKMSCWRLPKVNAALRGLNAVPRTVRWAQHLAHTAVLSCTNRLFVTFRHYNDTEAAVFLEKLVSFPCILALYCRFMSSESWWWFYWRRGEPWLWSDGWNASLPAPASRSNSLTASPRCRDPRYHLQHETLNYDTSNIPLKDKHLWSDCYNKGMPWRQYTWPLTPTPKLPS